eukprot:scaffold348240_cov17-Prasinocladus_malaysianus.AAC.1
MPARLPFAFHSNRGEPRGETWNFYVRKRIDSNCGQFHILFGEALSATSKSDYDVNLAVYHGTHGIIHDVGRRLNSAAVKPVKVTSRSTVLQTLPNIGSK